MARGLWSIKHLAAAIQHQRWEGLVVKCSRSCSWFCSCRRRRLKRPGASGKPGPVRTRNLGSKVCKARADADVRRAERTALAAVASPDWNEVDQATRTASKFRFDLCLAADGSTCSSHATLLAILCGSLTCDAMNNIHSAVDANISAGVTT